MTEGMQHNGMPMADMPAEGLMTEGMQHNGMPMADMPAEGLMTEGMNEEAVVQDEPLSLEFLAGPEGLSGQYSGLVHGLDLVGLELLDLEHNSLWSSDPQIQLPSPATTSHYQLAVQGEISSELVRGVDLRPLNQASPTRDLLDVYLPLRSTADGPVVGVLKLRSGSRSLEAIQRRYPRRSDPGGSGQGVGTESNRCYPSRALPGAAGFHNRRGYRCQSFPAPGTGLGARPAGGTGAGRAAIDVVIRGKGRVAEGDSPSGEEQRVKNNMQLISSLLSLQSGYITDEVTLLAMRDSQDRIKAMALVHEKLYGSEDLAMVDFHDYADSLVSGLFRSYGGDTAQITPRLEIHKIPMEIDMAVSCGLIINELVSNALKHAFTPQQSGDILVELFQEDSGNLVLKVEDTGAGFPAEVNFRETESLGLQLVCMLVEQLEGEIELESANGSRFQIIFPKQIE